MNPIREKRTVRALSHHAGGAQNKDIEEEADEKAAEEECEDEEELEEVELEDVDGGLSDTCMACASTSPRAIRAEEVIARVMTGRSFSKTLYLRRKKVVFCNVRKQLARLAAASFFGNKMTRNGGEVIQVNLPREEAKQRASHGTSPKVCFLPRRNKKTNFPKKKTFSVNPKADLLQLYELYEEGTG